MAMGQWCWCVARIQSYSELKNTRIVKQDTNEHMYLCCYENPVGNENIQLRRKHSFTHTHTTVLGCDKSLTHNIDIEQRENRTRTTAQRTNERTKQSIE